MQRASSKCQRVGGSCCCDAVWTEYWPMNKSSFGIWLLLLMSVVSTLACCTPSALADILDDKLRLWHSQAFLCEDLFPSKYYALYSEGCDDGDMTLFNGLLCLSGEQVGCFAVEASQDGRGRWWRSPRKKGKERSNDEDVSFSPDQALGVISYVIATRNVDKFFSWLEWISNHKSKLSEDQLRQIFKKQINESHVGDLLSKVILREISNLLPERLSYCTDDIDGRCTLRPADCALLLSVSEYLGRTRDICGNYLFFDSLIAAVNKLNQQPLLKLANLKIELPDVFALAGAYFNESNYPLHLAGVQVYIRKTMTRGNVVISEAERKIMERETKNPFFVFLGGDRDKALELLLMECPEGMTDRRQWAWERPDSEKAWEHRMFWDCIFVGNLVR
jgi:hypothetical protein